MGAWHDGRGRRVRAFRDRPSRPASSTTIYTRVVAGYLSQGWTVTATDYPGLGTPGPHPYIVGASEGRSVIDSVRAARNLDPTLSGKSVMSGHSQGGQAAIFASELADTYGKGLHLRGTVALAPASNIDLIAPALAGTRCRATS